MPWIRNTPLPETPRLTAARRAYYDACEAMNLAAQAGDAAAVARESAACDRAAYEFQAAWKEARGGG